MLPAAAEIIRILWSGKFGFKKAGWEMRKIGDFVIDGEIIFCIMFNII